MVVEPEFARVFRIITWPSNRRSSSGSRGCRGRFGSTTVDVVDNGVDTIDGGTGEVFEGTVAGATEPMPEARTLLTWAKELGMFNINVNAVAPTALTSMTAPLLEDPEVAKKRLARFPLGRYGAPEEIAPAFVYLASQESDYVTGQVLCVDGGLVI